MPFDDPRDFLEYLEERKELLRITDEVNPEFDIGAYIRKTSDQHGPALLFENVKGHNMVVVGGTFATRRRALMALEAPRKEINDFFFEGIMNPIPPRLVESGPCKEVILKGEDVDLANLPIPTYAKGDGGAFITHGVQISKDPDTGTKNASIYRMQRQGKRQMGILCEGYHDLYRQYVKAEAKGRPLEVAVALGVDPVVMLATQVRAGYGQDEMDCAGGLRRKAVDLVKCETVDLEVPAATEIVIEGLMMPHHREPEGPFGEYSGYYGPAQERPIVEITAITHRKDPIYHAGLTGAPMTENHFLKVLPYEMTMYKDLKAAFPGVQAVHYTAAGCCEYMVYVSMKTTFRGEGRNALMAVLGHVLHPKYAVVMDDDIDIFQDEKVLWAIATRAQPREDIVVIPKYPSPALDPTVPEGTLGSAMGIDATRPFGEPFPDVPVHPGLEKIPDLIEMVREGTA